MAQLTAATACLLLVLLGVTHGREAEDARLLAAISHVTVVSVSTTTTQVPFTCIKAMSTSTICAGGRKRRSVIQPFGRTDEDISSSSDLDASLTSEDLFAEDLNDEKARLQVTIWSTTTSPFTFTTTTTGGVTLSLSYACSLPLQAYPPTC